MNRDEWQGWYAMNGRKAEDLDHFMIQFEARMRLADLPKPGQVALRVDNISLPDGEKSDIIIEPPKFWTNGRDYLNYLQRTGRKT